MTEPRGYRRYLSHVIVACAAVALFAAWSKRDALAAWWNRPAAPPAAHVAPVVNVESPVINVPAPILQLPPPKKTLYRSDEDYVFKIGDRELPNAVIYDGGWVRWNDSKDGGPMEFNPKGLRWERRTEKTE